MEKTIETSYEGSDGKKYHYEVFDNYLPAEEFDKIRYLLLPTAEERLEILKNQSEISGRQVNWTYTPNVVNLPEEVSIPESEIDPEFRLEALQEKSDEELSIALNQLIHTAANYKEKTQDWRLIYLVHMIYDYTITSPFFNNIIAPFDSLLDIKTLIRIKINMYPNTETMKEHGMHSDYPFSHKSGVFYINTCNGYTRLEDDTKIDSVANRILLFDASRPHTPSTTTDQSVRMNINFNYF